MGDTSLINFNGLSEPATLLIKKISNALEGSCKPWQIRRVARAEADAEIIRVTAQIQKDELQRRALDRFIAEETRKQINIENITSKAIGELNECAKPQDIEDDWIVNYFDKCRLISDDQMQVLWAKILSGEANSPGKYSKRTLACLASLDKSDALLFQNLCAFTWNVGENFLLIDDYRSDIYKINGITFDSLLHLASIGLIVFEYNPMKGFTKEGFPQKIIIRYGDKYFKLKFETEEDNAISTGCALFTNIGLELSGIIDPQPKPNYVDYIVTQWIENGYALYCDWPQTG